MHLSPFVFANALMLLGGIIYPFLIFDRSRVRAFWAKCCSVPIGLGCITIGAGNLALHFHYFELTTPEAVHLKQLILYNICGFVLGLFFALIISGELWGKQHPETLPPA